MRVETTSNLAGQQTAAARSTKLKDGAQQFEAMMLEQMLKPLHFGQGVDAGDEEATGANGTLGDFGTEAVAKALAAGGGFGLARQIVRQVTKEDEAVTAGSGGTKV